MSDRPNTRDAVTSKKQDNNAIPSLFILLGKDLFNSHTKVCLSNIRYSPCTKKRTLSCKAHSKETKSRENCRDATHEGDPKCLKAKHSKEEKDGANILTSNLKRNNFLTKQVFIIFHLNHLEGSDKLWAGNVGHVDIS